MGTSAMRLSSSAELQSAGAHAPRAPERLEEHAPVPPRAIVRSVEPRDEVSDRLRAVVAVRAQLIARGLARPAALSELDTHYFLAAEVASVLEHRRAIQLDPAVLTPAELDASRAREPLALENLEHEPREGALVLLENGARIGTVCFDDFEGLAPYAHVSSLYVAPQWRGRGVASELLDVMHAMLVPPYAGLSLTTYWTWPRAVQFYLRHGCVVRQWKHALVFLWRSEAVFWEVQFEGDVATFVWHRAGAAPRTWTAQRRAGWLAWTEPREQSGPDGDWYDATMTFAVVLASRGWPIARSEETLAEGARWSDCGYPEGLAVKIERWEAYDRERGYVVDTPRLPSLPYRDWTALKGP